MNECCTGNPFQFGNLKVPGSVLSNHQSCDSDGTYDGEGGVSEPVVFYNIYMSINVIHKTYRQPNNLTSSQSNPLCSTDAHSSTLRLLKILIHLHIIPLVSIKRLLSIRQSAALLPL